MMRKAGLFPWWLVLVLAGCDEPSVGENFACTNNSDCLAGYRCNTVRGACELDRGGGACSNGVCPDSVTLAFTGPLEAGPIEVGTSMKNGMEAWFRHLNTKGLDGTGTSPGVNGRQVVLTALDDGGAASRATNNIDGVTSGADRAAFAVIGAVGDEAARNIVSLTNERGVLFVGGLTGSDVLRPVAPDALVFHYRPGHREETAALIDYLRVRHTVARVPASNIAAFLQGFEDDARGFFDAYGESGFAGAQRELAKDHSGDPGVPGDRVPYATYDFARPKSLARSVTFFLHWLGGATRGELMDALSITGDSRVSWPQWEGITPAGATFRAAIVGVATAVPMAELVAELNNAINAVRRIASPDRDESYQIPVGGQTTSLSYDEVVQIKGGLISVTFASVSSVNSAALGRELNAIDSLLCPEVIVSEVVPEPLSSNADIVVQYREHLAQVTQNEPDPVSLEGYLVARLFTEGLARHGARALTSAGLADTLETLELNLGLGATLAFDSNRHQASNYVWGNRLDGACKPRAIADW